MAAGVGMGMGVYKPPDIHLSALLSGEGLGKTRGVCTHEQQKTNLRAKTKASQHNTDNNNLPTCHEMALELVSEDIFI